MLAGSAGCLAVWTQGEETETARLCEGEAQTDIALAMNSLHASLLLGANRRPRLVQTVGVGRIAGAPNIARDRRIER